MLLHLKAGEGDLILITELVFCRFVLPCQIFLPPIKTVGSKIRQRKMLAVKL